MEAGGEATWNYSARITLREVGTFLLEVYVDGTQVTCDAAAIVGSLRC